MMKRTILVFQIPIFFKAPFRLCISLHKYVSGACERMGVTLWLSLKVAYRFNLQLCFTHQVWDGMDIKSRLTTGRNKRSLDASDGTWWRKHVLTCVRARSRARQDQIEDDERVND